VSCKGGEQKGKKGQKNPRTSEKVRGSRGPLIIGPHAWHYLHFVPVRRELKRVFFGKGYLEVAPRPRMLEIVIFCIAIHIHPWVILSKDLILKGIEKCFFEVSVMFHIVLLIIEPPLYHVSHIVVKSLIFGSFLLFFVCIMQRQQVSCKGGERLTDNGHKKTPPPEWRRG